MSTFFLKKTFFITNSIVRGNPHYAVDKSCLIIKPCQQEVTCSWLADVTILKNKYKIFTPKKTDIGPFIF